MYDAVELLVRSLAATIIALQVTFMFALGVKAFSVWRTKRVKCQLPVHRYSNIAVHPFHLRDIN